MCVKSYSTNLYIWIRTNIRLADTTKKTWEFQKRASPLSPGMQEYVHLVPKKLKHGPYKMRHGLVGFRFCTRTIRTPSEIWELYKSIFMPYSQPLNSLNPSHTSVCASLCCRLIIIRTVEEYFWHTWQGQTRYVWGGQTIDAGFPKRQGKDSPRHRLNAGLLVLMQHWAFLRRCSVLDIRFLHGMSMEPPS
jgi:hypothetical protein